MRQFSDLLPTSIRRRVRVKRTARHFFCRPRLEQLEPRETPSADLFTNMVAEIVDQAPDLLPSVPYYLSRMRADGGFSDLNYRGNSDASASDLMQVGMRLEAISVAYKWNDPSNTYFNNPTLKSQVLQGWNYLAAKGGTVTAHNWWWKAIGVPQGLADGLVVMRDEMSSKVRGQILSRYFTSVWSPSKFDGANLTYQAPIAMIDGMLRGNASRIRDVVSKVSTELLTYSGEGLRPDLSFFQHRAGGKYDFYNGSYGMVFVRDVSRVMRWTGGTPYAFSVSAVDQEVRFVVDGQAWLTRGDTFDIPSQGRSITRSGSPTSQPQVLRNAMADLVPLGRRTDELLAAIDRYENGVSDTNALSGNKSFWSGDAMANQRPEMLTTVKMLSNRVARPETAAGENRQGFFLGDGFTMFLQDGDEFGRRGGPDIMQVWDWQRLPGTTVEHNGKIPYYDMFSTATNSAGGSNIVGSVSDGTYGLAAMDYRRSGVTVTAKKAWFFFDNEVVALGAGINDPGGAPVFTSLNQVFLDGPVTVQDASGRRTFDVGGYASLQGQGWIEQDGLGYVLLDASDRTTVQAVLQGGLPVFSAWVDHGIAPQNATYAYAVVPGVTPDELDSYSSALPIKIIANTPAVQAVQQTDLQQTQIAFYAAGSVRISDSLTISVDRPANLILEQVGSDLRITASDPRQSSTSLTIAVSGQLDGPGVTLLADGRSQIAFTLWGGSYLGSSVTRTFHISDAISSLASMSAASINMLLTSPSSQSADGPSGEGMLPLLSNSAPAKTAAPAAAPKSPSTDWSLLIAAANRLSRGHHRSIDPATLNALAIDAALAEFDIFQ